MYFIYLFSFIFFLSLFSMGTKRQYYCPTPIRQNTSQNILLCNSCGEKLIIGNKYLNCFCFRYIRNNFLANEPGKLAIRSHALSLVFHPKSIFHSQSDEKVKHQNKHLDSSGIIFNNYRQKVDRKFKLLGVYYFMMFG